MWPVSEERMPSSLDRVVTSVAAQLMEATASTSTLVSQTVLAQLVEQLRLDAGFLRHHDHEIRASVLVAEWPPRADVPDRDPLAVVPFGATDSLLSLCEHGKKPVVIRRISRNARCGAGLVEPSSPVRRPWPPHPWCPGR